MDFLPESNKQAYDVPFFEDARAENGWEGQGTSKKIAILEQELFAEIARLGGGVTGIVKGSFHDGHHQRQGYRISFVIQRDSGAVDPARLDVAALPCRKPKQASKKQGVSNAEASLQMMLYMLRNALKGMWFMRQLSPGFVPLMPFLLVNGQDKTLSELYSAQGMFSKLLPSPQADFVEGEVIEIK